MNREVGARTRSNTWLCLIAVPCLISLPHDVRAEFPNETNPEAFISIMNVIVQSDDPQLAFRSSARNIVLVFVPGVLGSRLVERDSPLPKGAPACAMLPAPHRDTIVWGGNTPDMRRLALRSGKAQNAVNAGTLYTTGRIFGLKRVNVYGSYDAVISTVANGKVVQEDLAYDWRRDLDELAREMNVRIKNFSENEKLKGKSVIIVAHSMGGLLAFRWQGQYYQPEDPSMPKIRRLYLLGAPLQGSCESLRMLFDGYEPEPSASIFLRAVYRQAFGDRLRCPAFTFPGLFELLPKVPRNTSLEGCFSGSPPQRPQANYFAPEFWESPFLAKRIDRPWKCLGVDKKEFFKDLRTVLTRASDFRDTLDLSVRKVPMVIVYADKFDTTSDLGSSCEGMPQKCCRKKNGDGRVSAASAKNAGYLNRPDVRFIRAESSHGNLPNDNIFLNYVGTDLEEIDEAEKVLAGIDYLLEHPDLISSYVSQGGSFLSYTPLCRILAGECSTSVASKVIAFNELVKSEERRINSTITNKLTFDYLRLAQNRLGDSAMGKQVPAMEMALHGLPEDRLGNVPFALNRIGLALMSSKRYEDAVSVLRVALQNVYSGDMVQTAPNKGPGNFESKILNNLGLSESKIGDCHLAREHLKMASKLGNPRSRGNLAEQCTDSETGNEHPVMNW